MRRELDRLPVERDAAGLGIQDDRPALDLALGMARRAAHLGAHARQEFFHVEGLGEIVVGAGIDPGHLVGPAVARRQDDHRHLAVGPAPGFEDADAVHLGQAQIKNDDVIGLRLTQETAFLAVGRLVDDVTRLAERGHELAVQVRIIFDDECAHDPSRVQPGSIPTQMV
jgi:hypothetical protein